MTEKEVQEIKDEILELGSRIYDLEQEKYRLEEQVEEYYKYKTVVHD